MCSNIPKYLNEHLFQDALNDGFRRNDVTIKSLHLKLTSEGGENYCSDIYRANVGYTTDGKEIKTIALIVKDMKDSVNEEIPMASKESDLYTLLAPQMDEVLGEPDVLVPKCFTASNEFYIFQDLGDLGYTVQDRLKGLNESQAQVLLKKIAVFHAASMVVVEKHPDLIAKVGKSIFEEGIEHIPIGAELAYGNLEYFTELAKQWHGFEEIVSKLQKLRSTYNDKLIAMINSKETKFKVFNHGDLWVNNMLFKHDGDTCVDARLIDFQNCSYGSPGLDLHYFFATSVPMELGLTKKYGLLRTYYKTLKTTLLQLKYSAVPTWDDLLHEMRDTEFYTVQTALLAIPLIFLAKDASKGSDLDSLKDPNFMKNQRVNFYNSARTLATTRYIFDRVNDLGILD